jgi:hypothetical protein
MEHPAEARTRIVKINLIQGTEDQIFIIIDHIVKGAYDAPGDQQRTPSAYGRSGAPAASQPGQIVRPRVTRAW